MIGSTPTVLVVGATGNVGRRLVPRLLGRGARVRAAPREPEAYAGPDGAEPVRFDLDDPATWDGALDGADRAFLIAKSADPAAHETLNPFVDRARAAGVARVVLMTADGVQHDDEAGMRKAERHLGSSGLAFTVLGPSWFMQNVAPGFLHPMVLGGTIYLPAGDGKSAFVNADDIAAVAAEALLGDGHDGAFYTVTGPEALDYPEATAVHSEAAGRAIRYRPVPDDALRQSLAAAGWRPEQVELMVGLFGAVRAGHAAGPTDDVERVTGRPPRSLQAFAAEHADALRPS